MTPEKLVLLKSRSQRLAEMIILPAVLLPIGPAMRLLLGDRYSVPYGLLAYFPLILIVSVLSTRWAAWRGGEWVSKAERLRRLREEAANSQWSSVLAPVAMIALTLFSGFLLIKPFDEFEVSLGGGHLVFAPVAFLCVLAGVQCLFNRRQLARSEISDEPPPPGNYRTALMRILPGTYLAYSIGVVTGIIVGLESDEAARFWVYLVVSLAVSEALRQVFLRGRAPQRLYPAGPDPKVEHFLLMGLTCFGVPMGILFIGMTVLENMNKPMMMALMIGTTIVTFAVLGPLFGAFVYLLCRLADPRRARPE